LRMRKQVLACEKSTPLAQLSIKGSQILGLKRGR
jgi:hypothetical protein